MAVDSTAILLRDMDQAHGAFKERIEALIEDAERRAAEAVSEAAELRNANLTLNELVGHLKDRIAELEGDKPKLIELATPSDLTAEVKGLTVTLRWKDNSDGEDGYIIEQRDTHGPKDAPWQIRKTAGPNATACEITVPNPLTGWRYDFRVRATRQDPDDPSQELTSEPAVLRDVLVTRVNELPETPPAEPTHPPPAGLQALRDDPRWDNALRPKTVTEAVAAVETARKTGQAVVIANLDFGSSQLRLENCQWVHVLNCRWSGIPGGWWQGHAICIVGGLSYSIIEKCEFENCGDADIAGGYGNSRQLYILYNWHHDTKEGIHLIGGGPDTTVYLSGMLAERLTRMAVEVQNGGTEYVIEDVLGRDWRNVNRDSFLISGAVNECKRLRVRRVVGEMRHYQVKGDPPNRLGILVEAGAEDALVEDVIGNGPWVTGTGLSNHSSSRKSTVHFRDVRVYNPNRPWAKPQVANLIYNDGGSKITAENVVEVSAPIEYPAFVEALASRGLPA